MFPPFLGRKNNIYRPSCNQTWLAGNVPICTLILSFKPPERMGFPWISHMFFIFSNDFPIVSNGISPCQPHFGWHPPQELRSSQTFWRSAWTPRRVSGGSRSITSQWRKIRTAGASLVGRWRGYPGYLLNVSKNYLKCVLYKFYYIDVSRIIYTCLSDDKWCL